MAERYYYCSGKKDNEASRNMMFNFGRDIMELVYPAIFTPYEDGTGGDEQFVSLIALDMDAYAAKYGNRAVKKTLTIPAWLNTFVENNGISCSKVLQEALCKMAQVK